MQLRKIREAAQKKKICVALIFAEALPEEVISDSRFTFHPFHRIRRGGQFTVFGAEVICSLE